MKFNFLFKYRKGETTLLTELVYLVIGIFALVIIISKGLPVLMTVVFNAPDKNSVNNYERLVEEIQMTINEYRKYESQDKLDSFIESYDREVPININTKLGIRFYNANEDMPATCKNKDMICVCIAYLERYNDNKAPYKCKGIENAQGISFNKIGDSVNSDLIVGKGIGAYRIRFLEKDMIVIDYSFDPVEVESAYVEFSKICKDSCDVKVFEGSSLSPKGSPFGDGVTTRITSGYYSYYYQQDFSRLAPHKGLDIVPSDSFYVKQKKLFNDVGPVFFAVCDGYAYGDVIGGGNKVILVCDDGIHKIGYLHNEKNFVPFGEVNKVHVNYGSPLGIMGNTGNSAGAHIHYTVHKQGTVINPLLYISSTSFDSSRDRDGYDKEANCQISQCAQSGDYSRTISESCNSVCTVEFINTKQASSESDVGSHRGAIE